MRRHPLAVGLALGLALGLGSYVLIATPSEAGRIRGRSSAVAVLGYDAGPDAGFPDTGADAGFADSGDPTFGAVNSGAVDVTAVNGGAP